MKPHHNSLEMGYESREPLFPPPSSHPQVIKVAYKSNGEVVFLPDHSQLGGLAISCARGGSPQKDYLNHSTAGRRELRLDSRLPARFISLSNTQRLTTTSNTETQKQLRQPVTPLLAQRIPLSGNSYFWRTAAGCASRCSELLRIE
jgi:hypothetical protein